MRQKIWEFIDGKELQFVHDRGEPLAELLGNAPALYIWRRKISPPQNVVQNAPTMAKWVNQAVCVPVAELPAAPLAHFLYHRGITVGGTSLTEDKEKTLRFWLRAPQNRKWLYDFLTRSNELIPPLYVGETDNLSRRVRDHLRGDTDFAQILENKLGLSWKETTLGYCAVEDLVIDKSSNKELRTLLEMIVSRLALAPSTSRPG